MRGAGNIPIDDIEAFYSARALPSRVMVTTAADARVDAMLAARGYAIEAPVDILVASIDTVTQTISPHVEIEVSPTRVLDTTWADDVYGALHDGNDRVAAYGRMLASIGPSACAVTVPGVAMAFGVVEREWCGVFGMTVVAGHRRQGIGSTVLHALAREAATIGASDMYLQVERDNEPALALYRRAGFTFEYGYHYRTRVTTPA